MDSLLIESPQTQSLEIEYPASDGQPMAETEIHVLAILHLISALRHVFRQAADVYVIGNIFLYYVKGNPRARKAPDVMVVKGVGKQLRRSFKLWEEPAAPCVIFEMTSRETKDEDLTTKFTLYARLGVQEYFLFDPLHEYLDHQLQGYRLVDGVYHPIPPNEDGELFSQELQLILRPDGAMLRVVDPQDHQAVPDLDEAVERAEQEAQRAEQEAQRAEQEAQRAEQEAQRANTAEEEVARLRALLAQIQQSDQE
jgi:Uma2 family endonuclease